MHKPLFIQVIQKIIYNLLLNLKLHCKAMVQQLLKTPASNVYLILTDNIGMTLSSLKGWENITLNDKRYDGY